MAIIDAIPGLEVRVMVDGKPLREYLQLSDHNDDDEKYATRYIVAEPGKAFSVDVKRKAAFRMGGPRFDIAIWLSLDGNYVMGDFLERNTTRVFCRKLSTAEIQVSPGEWVEKNFVFSDLVFDDKAAIPKSAKEIDAAQNLGDICVSMKRGRIGKHTAPPAWTAEDASENKSVHEKALKGRAISHTTSYTEAVPCEEPQYAEFKEHDKEPFATFTFKYRSLTDLKAEMIVPRSPSPVPLEDRPIEELSPDEMRALLRQQRDSRPVKPEPMRVKRERMATGTMEAQDDEDDELEIVQGPPKRPRVVEHIDLT